MSLLEFVGSQYDRWRVTMARGVSPAHTNFHVGRVAASLHVMTKYLSTTSYPLCQMEIDLSPHLPSPQPSVWYNCIPKRRRTFPLACDAMRISLPRSPYSSIFSSSSSSSSSSSNAFLANRSASSLSSLGTSRCNPLVGPSRPLIHVISSSNSLSLLSSCAT